MIRKRTVADLAPAAVEGRRAVVRVDFNVPIKDGVVGDTTRIRTALPTIKMLIDRGARVVLLAHLGRPKGDAPDPRFSLRPVASVLERLLGSPVRFIEEPAAAEAVEVTKSLPRGAVALVENTRFLKGEEENDATTARLFAALGDCYVNDAFGSAHRAHASTEGVAHLLKPAVAGLLMEKELAYLGRLLETPGRPFVAVLGGAKISGKIDVIENLLPRVDHVLIGGAMAATFFRARGTSTGTSLVEEDRVALAAELLERAGSKLVLPDGAVVAESLDRSDARREVPWDAIPDGWAMYDIDQPTREHFGEIITAARTVVWNGPMGVFETTPFDEGTAAVARAMAAATAAGAVTVVGGGDSAAAIAALELETEVSHVSTGGGASLEFLEGRVLPGVAALDDRVA